MGSEAAPLSGDDLDVIDVLIERDGEKLAWQMGFCAALVLGIFGAAARTSFSALVVTSTALALVTAVYVVARHATLLRGRAGSRGVIWAAASNRSQRPDTSRLPAVYVTYILGSGGHTGEICELIKQSYHGHENLHRRYVMTSGDTHSPNAVAALETLVRDTADGRPTGTFDVVRVLRARRVHQSFSTAWFTSLLSAFSIVQALVLQPRDRPRDTHGGEFRYPHVIVTNGPGTGFVVCLVVHLLKVFFLVPSNRLKVLYIETWAHISTLSLTGKLFYHTDLADLFLVQHKQLANKTGKPWLQLFKPPSFATGSVGGKGMVDGSGDELGGQGEKS